MAVSKQKDPQLLKEEFDWSVSCLSYYLPFSKT